MADRPLSVLHLVCSDAFAGVERYLAYVAPALAAQGVAVTVAGGDRARMAAELGPHGVAHLPADRPLDALALLSSGSVRRQRPDLLHVHMTEAEVAAVATRPLVRRPVVATLHFARPRGTGALRRRVWAVLPHLLARQVAISRYVAAASGQPCVVIPHGVPEPGGGPPPAAAGRQRTVLVAQRFEPEKRTVVALEVWRASGLADRGWTLRLAGSGSEEPLLRATARRLGVEGSVEWPGFLSRDDLHRELRRCALFVATTPVEGFGISVVEAMASALPVVASASGGHLETVAPADDRFLFDVGDHAAGGRALRTLAEDPVARDRYGAALRQRYLDEYTVERHARRLLDLYRVVTGRGAAAATSAPPARSPSAGGMP